MSTKKIAKTSSSRTRKTNKSGRVVARKSKSGVPSAKKDAIEKGKIGQSFDAFLMEEGCLAETKSQAVKRVIAFQLTQVMKKQNLTKTELAAQLNTSRSQVNRLLDPENTSITLETLSRAAQAVGHELQLELH